MAICEWPSGDDGFGATEHNMIRDLIFGIGILVVGAIMAMFMLPRSWVAAIIVGFISGGVGATVIIGVWRRGWCR